MIKADHTTMISLYEGKSKSLLKIYLAKKLYPKLEGTQLARAAGVHRETVRRLYKDLPSLKEPESSYLLLSESFIKGILQGSASEAAFLCKIYKHSVGKKTDSIKFEEYQLDQVIKKTTRKKVMRDLKNKNILLQKSNVFKINHLYFEQFAKKCHISDPSRKKALKAYVKRDEVILTPKKCHISDPSEKKAPKVDTQRDEVILTPKKCHISDPLSLYTKNKKQNKKLFCLETKLKQLAKHHGFDLDWVKSEYKKFEHLQKFNANKINHWGLFLWSLREGGVQLSGQAAYSYLEEQEKLKRNKNAERKRKLIQKFKQQLTEDPYLVDKFTKTHNVPELKSTLAEIYNEAYPRPIADFSILTNTLSELRAKEINAPVLAKPKSIQEMTFFI